jgi:hypothetical protein
MKTILRSVLALLAAALAPAALILVPYVAELLFNPVKEPAAWFRFNIWLSAVIGTSFFYVIVLGVPAFLILRWRNAIRWWSATGVGFVLGCLPVAYSLWPYDTDSTSSHWTTGMVATVIDGVPTLAGWIRYAKMVGLFGMFGAVGGIAFWLVWHSMRSNNALQATCEDARA